MMLETIVSETHYRRGGDAPSSAAKIGGGIDSSYSSSLTHREREREREYTVR
jgi:hypothetical protein